MSKTQPEGQPTEPSLQEDIPVQTGPAPESSPDMAQVQADKALKAVSEANIVAVFYRELVREGVPMEIARDLTIGYITTALRRDGSVL